MRNFTYVCNFLKRVLPSLKDYKHFQSCLSLSKLLSVIKFIYSKKASKFCKITTLLLSYEVPVKSKVEILQYFVAFSEYMNFKISKANYDLLNSSKKTLAKSKFFCSFFGRMECKKNVI